MIVKHTWLCRPPNLVNNRDKWCYYLIECLWHDKKMEWNTLSRFTVIPCWKNVLDKVAKNYFFSQAPLNLDQRLQENNRVLSYYWIPMMQFVLECFWIRNKISLILLLSASVHVPVYSLTLVIDELPNSLLKT